jgi:hypothetical protein
MKYCEYCQDDLKCAYTGFTIVLEENGTQEIYGEVRKFTVHGDLFFCRDCKRFSLYGANVPYFSPDEVRTQGVMKGSYEQGRNNGYNCFNGELKVFKSERENMERKSPGITAIMDEYYLWEE